MKVYILSIVALLGLLLGSCEKDNYEEPKNDLTGRVVDATSKKTIGVRQTEGAVQMQLYQDGFQKRDPIPVYINQDGTFSAKLFNGTCKLVTRDNNGPWINDRDTLVVNVKGNTDVEYSVKPYFMLKDESFVLNGNILTAKFTVDQINAIQDRGIERITLYVNNTTFVDDSFSKRKSNASTPAIGENTITMDIGLDNDGKPTTAITSKPILYARVGLKINGVSQLVYTTGSKKVK